MTTFNVSDVKLCQQRLGSFEIKDSIQLLTKKPIEACGALQSKLVKNQKPMNSLLLAMHMAFKDHYPLILSPDDVWITIMQGLALHVDVNAENLRNQFVQHQDKFTLTHENAYQKGSADNDWPSSFKWFSERIQEIIGKKHALIVSDFSTTGLLERIVSEIVLLYVVKNYFDYREDTKCGIPEITLLGTAEDWKSIRSRTEFLNEFGLSWWTDHLIPVLDEFVAAKNGSANNHFWTSLYHWKNASGGEQISGYVNSLFPYVQNREKTGFTKQNDNLHGKWGFSPGEFPIGISIVPFVWNYLGTKYDMDFLGGFVGVSQDPDFYSVRPALGWAVRDRPRS